MSVRLTRRPLSVTAAARALGGAGGGGLTIFVGRVRPDRVRTGVVVALDYEADPVRALRAMERVESEVARRWNTTGTVLWHRVGRLPVGTASVIAGAAAGHRAEAFAAARALIERLKEEVPIWKRDRARPARRRPRRPSRRAGRSSG